MKIITVFVVIILASLFTYSHFQKPKPSTVTPSTQIVSPLHPLSIDNLSGRQFPPQQLKIERQVTQNSQVVSYLSDSLKLNALMITPKGTPPSGGWPIVIVNHGHIPPKEYSVTRSYINTSNYFASQGFLVLKPDYRGHDKSEGESSGRLLARSEYAVDILNLLSTINLIPNVNPQKIFMYGHSMGGEVTLQVLETSNKITAATLWGPSVTTLPQMVTYFANKNRPTPGQVEIFQNQYDEFIAKYPISQIASIENLDKIKTPLNIHHAVTDESVPYIWGTTLADKLKNLNKQVSFYTYPGDNHDISKNFGTALSRDAAFFKSFL